MRLLALGVVALAGILSTGAGFADETRMTLERGIDATLNVPDGAVGAPAVLMLHGFGSSKDEVGNMYAREAAALAEKGVASLRISFEGFGKSDGDTGETTVDQQLADALIAADYLASIPQIDRNKLGILGFSLGGGIAILATAERPDFFKSRVTWSSVGDFAEDMKGSVGQAAFDKAAADGIVGLDLGFRTIALKKAFFDSLSMHPLRDALAAYDGAYLAIAGSEDFSAKYAQAFVDAAPGMPKEAMIVEGADHIFGVLSQDQTNADKVITKTAEWFASTLQ